MQIRKINVRAIEYLAHRLATETMSWDEAIPPFETRYPNVLESCLKTPFQKFDKNFLYPGLKSKAAILFYLLIKNHPFQNGNKRIAVTTLFVFLAINYKWINIDNQELYNFAVWVAQSPPKLKGNVVKAIEEFIIINIIDLPKNRKKFR